MTDNLPLNIKPSQPCRLQLARARYEAAEAAWKAARTPVECGLALAELHRAESELLAAERTALEKRP